MASENQTLFKHMEFEYGLNLTETQLSEIVAICRTILLPNQNSEIANWCIVNALRLPSTTLALVVEKLSQHVPKTNKALPKLDIKFQEIKTDTAYGKFHSWTAELVGVEGMVAESGTKEGAIKELMKSIEAKLIFDMESR